MALADVGVVASDLGQLRMRQGLYVDASTLFEESALVGQRYLKPDDPEQLRVGLALADSYRLVSRFSDAKAIYQRIVPVLEKSGPADPTKNPVLDAWPRYAFVLAEQGDFPTAAVYANKTADAIRQIPSSQAVDRASRLAGLADIYCRIRELKEADSIARQATATLESLAPKDHPALPSAYFILGRTCLDLNNIPEAETYLRLALQGREKLNGPSHSATAIVAVSLAAVRLAQHRNSDAEDLAARSLPILEKGQGAQSVDVARTLEIIGAAQRAENDLPAAEASFKKAVNIRSQRQLPTHPAYIESLRNLDAIYVAEGKKDDSEAIQKQLQQARVADEGSVVEAKMKTN